MMLANYTQSQDITNIKNRVLRKFPLLGVAMSSLKNVADDGIETAGTDGHTVYYSPKFFSTLTEDEQTCVYAHEVMHVAFNHILRSKGRNPRLWNIATDSVINQMLKNADLPIVVGGVDMPDAANRSAEEMYEKLLEEREQKKQEQQDKNNSQKNQQQRGQGDSQPQQQQSPEEQDRQKEPQPQQQPQSQKSSGDQQQEQQNQENQDQGQSGQDKQNQDSRQGSSQGNGRNDDSDDEDENEQVGHDNHQIWKKAVEDAEKEQQRRQQQQQNGEGKRKNLLDRIKDLLASKENQDQKNPPQSQSSKQSSQNGSDQQRQKEDDSSFEKNFSAQNEKRRQQMIEQVRRSLERQKNETMKTMSEGGYSYGDLGAAKPVLDWKKMLKKSMEEEEDRWSYRRSGAENDFMARVEELEDENKSETEVMLDVSGSVNEQMLKEFLRQLKPILKTSKLKVGCFDHRIFDFKEIKNNKDIDNFVIRGGGGTDIDMAVRAFSKKKDVNKIVFTDGYSDSMPREDLKKANVIWLIYDNDDFHPVCGKVIYVDKEQIRQNYMSAESFQQNSFQQNSLMRTGR